MILRKALSVTTATKALEGNLGAIKEIFDRMDGKTGAGASLGQQPGKVDMQWKE
jgi:hypothetical protein